MAHFKQECTFCDNFISDKNFKVIEDVDIILLKLTLNESQNVICTTCSSKLFVALNFKSTCLSTNNTVIPYVDLKNPKPIDLKQIYVKEKGNKQGGRSLDDRDVCRLCLELVSGDHKSIQEVPVGSIEIYIPEINFEATTNPVICIKCHDALHVHSTFVKNCLDVVRKRNGDAMNDQEIFYNVESIKTEEIEIKSEEIDENILYETLCDINKEEHDEGDMSLQFQTDLPRGLKVQEYQCDKFTYNREDKNNFMQHQIIHKDPSEVHIYECDKCPYKSNRKGNFERHQLTHKDPAEVKIFKCNKCLFETKYKNNLINHSLTHKDPAEGRLFQCDECDYKSIQNGNLKQHQLTHKDPSEVNIFKCDKCSYATKQKNRLVKHCLTHRDPSEVQMFKCDECDYKSIRKSHVKRHQLRHKDPSEVQMYECDECLHKAMRKDHLKKHQLTHKDPAQVKMFKYDKCTFEAEQE